MSASLRPEPATGDLPPQPVSEPPSSGMRGSVGAAAPDSVSGRGSQSQAAAFTLPALFRRSARIYAERTAVVSADVALTYRELEERSNRLAHAMAAMDLARGDRVVVLSTTRPE